MQLVQENESAVVRTLRSSRHAVAAAIVLLVAACGGGGGGGSDTTAPGTGTTTPPVVTPPVATVQKPTALEASRFLGQATFGPTQGEVDHLTATTYDAWLTEQFAKPQTLHRLTIVQASSDLAALGQTVTPTNFFDSFWAQAIGGDDQLRQRATFALSEIFVVSFNDATLAQQTRGVASYYDMLSEKAFGNFRDLMEGVTYHPMMGIYLSHLKNQKEDPVTGRVPDLNFAREITQLFTVGEYQLNNDGSNILASNGLPTVAYVSKDLEGLSQVFTGLSWYAGPQLTDRTNARFFGNNANLERDWRPMQDYNEYTPNTSFHSITEKKFWSVTIPAQAKPDTVGDVKIALDTLFNNPNVGPFIGKQLIQRLVTSNPSPAYVGRVAAAFNNNGAGVRGDMKAVWKAVLLDSEARTIGTATNAGKLREPVVRLAQLLRAFKATSASGRYTGIGNTDDAASRLNQTVLMSPTVFNFFRPGYVPTDKALADANMVAPELQITHELSVAGYMNYVRAWTTVDKTRDIQQDYSAELALATTPDALVDRMNLLLFGGTMPAALKTQISTAVGTRAIPAAVLPAGGAASAASGVAVTPTNQAAIDAAKLDRVYIAVLLSMASPDYLIQK